MDRKNPMYIETNPDGGSQTIELWCYKEAEAEVTRLTACLELAGACMQKLSDKIQELERLSASQAEALNLMEGGKL